jgi:elongation factor 4
MYPEPLSQAELSTGQVGFLILNMKSTREAHIGDTFFHTSVKSADIQVLPGFRPAKSMVFAGLYPMDPAEYTHLSDAIDRLTLNDSSVSVSRETSTALGQGFRLGFLGTLHMDVFRERLEDEYHANVINTMPTVPYLIKYYDGKEKIIYNPIEFPELSEHMHIKEFLEPYVMGTLVFPSDHLGSLMDLCGSRRGEIQDYSFLDDQRVIMKCRLPMSEVLTDFYDQLKSKSSGYASFDYEEIGHYPSELHKVNILLNGKPVDALSSIVHSSQSTRVAKEWVKRLKDVMERQLFEIVIQASVNNKILARET